MRVHSRLSFQALAELGHRIMHVLIAGPVFQLDDDDWQAIEKQHDIGPHGIIDDQLGLESDTVLSVSTLSHAAQ